MNTTAFLNAFAAALAIASAAAQAHGDEDHAKTDAAHHDDHAAALGKPGDPAKVDRTVAITMRDDMRFTPSSVSAKKGETIRFVLTNEGKLKHEMVLGTLAELKEHAALMRKFPEMEHADPNQASVAPGKTGELVWQFTKAGTFDFACLQAGHYEAGMKGRVVVADAAADDMTEGEVRKVDKDAQKLTIRHGPIRNLDMPGMTMVFQVRDPAQLADLQPGDKIRFRAEHAGGAFVATEIQPAK
jgi:uncharacterized cupredoxin-like copper-binding protein